MTFLKTPTATHRHSPQSPTHPVTHSHLPQSRACLHTYTPSLPLDRVGRACCSPPSSPAALPAFLAFLAFLAFHCLVSATKKPEIFLLIHTHTHTRTHAHTHAPNSSPWQRPHSEREADREAEGEAEETRPLCRRCRLSRCHPPPWARKNTSCATRSVALLPRSKVVFRVSTSRRFSTSSTGLRRTCRPRI